MRFIAIIFFSILYYTAHAQSDTTVHAAAKNLDSDTLGPYLLSPQIPTFSLQQADSSWFYNTSIKAKKPVLILYFSPDCGHCQIETDNILANLSKLQKLQVIMITSRSFEDMAAFAVHYKINKFPSVVMGRDAAHYITRFYNVKFTPFSALYNKKGKLIKIYRKGIDMEELIKLVS